MQSANQVLNPRNSQEVLLLLLLLLLPCSECNSFKIFLQQISFVSVKTAAISKIWSRVKHFAVSECMLLLMLYIIAN